MSTIAVMLLVYSLVVATLCGFIVWTVLSRKECKACGCYNCDGLCQCLKK